MTEAAIHVYGIPTCTTVRKARKFLEVEGVPHSFTAFADTPDLAARLRDWMARSDAVLNTRAATFRALEEADRTRALGEPDHAIALMAADPRLIKRPVLDTGTALLTGFDADAWRAVL